jgi:hypothetical protein
VTCRDLPPASDTSLFIPNACLMFTCMWRACY